MSAIFGFQAFILAFLLPTVFTKADFVLGKCPQVEAMKDFDYKKFCGTWYAIQRTSSGSTCITYEFLENEDGSKSVKESARPFSIKVDMFGGSDRLSEMSSLTASDSAHPAEMIQTINGLLVNTESAFLFVDTDYISYAAILICHKVPLGHWQSAIILSREKTLPQDQINKLRDKFRYHNVKEYKMSIVDQKGCYYNLTNHNTDDPATERTSSTPDNASGLMDTISTPQKAQETVFSAMIPSTTPMTTVFSAMIPSTTPMTTVQPLTITQRAVSAETTIVLPSIKPGGPIN